ncbi:hypothetical protein C5167_004456 [Papaver somniferum]|uniref:Uncharacterized protein n=1 Tax=Papaver somniferum TaxID=3469 RepID=A0A4Y7JB45_PAPSO|nr:hypothetical protein C5167_004456 [Papaver somniferum]
MGLGLISVSHLNDIDMRLDCEVPPTFNRRKLMGDQMLRNLELQNIQTFIKMVLIYMLASPLPWDCIKLGFDLVLGASNADVGLCGHLTKKRKIDKSMDRELHRSVNCRACQR